MRFVHQVSACLRLVAVALAAASLVACATAEPLPNYRNVVVSADRTDSDRAIDQRRDPEKLLEFYGVRPGMRVLDMSTGRGYNTELLARVVGPTGRVYAQNSPALTPAAANSAIAERLKTPAMALSLIHI